jgi:hypothetical protein
MEIRKGKFERRKEKRGKKEKKNIDEHIAKD